MMWDTSFPVVIIYVAATTTIYLFFLFSYRLLFHPLRSYPGPVLAKLSDAYSGFYAAGKRFHIKTRLILLQYGLPLVQRHSTYAN
jgi:hypothetical protein